MHRNEYFDHLALNWDREVTGEMLECLNNIINYADFGPTTTRSRKRSSGCRM